MLNDNDILEGKALEQSLHNARKAELEAELQALREDEPPLFDKRDGIVGSLGVIAGAGIALAVEAFL